MLDLFRFVLTRYLAVLVFVQLLFVNATQGQEDPDAVAGTVGNWAIKIKDVDRQLDVTLKDRKIDSGVRSLLRAQTLYQMTGQQLVIDYLVAANAAAGDADVQVRIEQIKLQLASIEKPFTAYLESLGFDAEPELARNLKFKMSWESYLKRHLNEENLRKHFGRHRRELDDTKLRISQILLAAESGDGKDADVLAPARKIKQQLDAKELTWDEAVKQFSTSPSRKDNGDIGWIERRKPMPEKFSKIAFALESGKIADPFLSRFGIHIIKCTEIEAGKTTFEDARDRVSEHATKFLFDFVYKRQHQKSKLKFTGKCAYLDPDSKQLILPKR